MSEAKQRTLTGAIERLTPRSTEDKPREPYDVEDMAYRIAAYDSAEYFLAKMRLAHVVRGKRALIYQAIEQSAVEGLILEFGVAVGWSIRRIAEKVSGPIYGFDSFDGLPEDWTHFQRKGRYGSRGRPPS